MRAVAFLLKDKRFFHYHEPKLAGNPVAIAKKLKEEGVKLIHIKDPDIRTMKNYDIYDSLTYIINIEVEAPCDEKIIKRLLGINARVVVELPCPMLERFKEKKKLLVGKMRSWQDVRGIESVNDLIVFREQDIKKAERLGKRVLFFGKTKEKVFAEIERYV